MNYDYIITKPELNEGTLAHYGVKGMKWRHRKGRTKNDLRSDRPRSRVRNVTGQGTGAYKTGKVKSADQKLDYIAKHLAEDRSKGRYNYDTEANSKAARQALTESARRHGSEEAALKRMSDSYEKYAASAEKRRKASKRK